PWMLSFEDTFQRATLGPDWRVLDGEWRLDNGSLVGHGSLLCLRRFRGYHRVEIEAVALTDTPCDLSVFLQANEEGWKSGVFFGFGSDMNTGSKLLLRGKETVRSDARIVPGRTHRILCECEGSDLRHVVDGAEILRFSNTPEFVQAARAEALRGKQCERTLVQVSLSAADSYYADIFRVVGGRDHAKFMHSHFGAMTTRGLNLKPAADYGHGTIMRDFKSDPAAAPGWSADWTVEDRYRILREPRDIHLRFTDFTTGAEAATCEGWVVGGHFNTRQETWIPRLMVRRQAREGVLASTFVGVMEPYEKTSGIASIRRLPLTTPDGRPYGDAHVALEVRLADGRSDLILAADADNPRNERPAPAEDGGLVQPDWGVRTDAELCVVRKNAAGAIVHVALGQGRTLQAGAVKIELKEKTEFVERAL
ncbi:MAG: hypothetical protein HY343_10005, partial [Lentisphaerae bacterium]|nr:hypothetical protein [Lentisphaerota bacterium]